MLRCSVCGDELTNEMNFCPGCGVAVKGKEVSAAGKEKNRGSGDSEQTKNKGSKADKNSASAETKVQVNAISTTKLFYIVFTLIIIGGLLVYSSGVFDSPQISATSQQGAQNNPHAGVDLNNLEQINSLQTFVDQNPDDGQSLLQLAHLYNDSGMKEKAIERYIQYLKKDPKNPDV
ncbi:MAG: tetratricopeptide repeat protein, partial [Melioribacteraceae bacterium]